MIKVLFAARASRWAEFAPHLRSAFAEARLEVDLRQDWAPDAVDYIVYAPNSKLNDFTPFTKLKAVLNLWAGVEDVVGNTTLKAPLCRMVDPGLTEGMVEWVTGHVLRYHLGIDAVLAEQSGRWVRHVPPLARESCVGILGLGTLGQAVAKSLAALNFEVCGWSRRGSEAAGVTCFSGAEGKRAVLERADYLVLLLPLTPETENTLDAEALALLPPGAVVINPGRGALIDDDALLQALEAGQVRHATLDVFRTEPLPPDHPFWAHRKITVTPHIASETRAASAARVIADNIKRGESGEPLLHVVDRVAGY